MAAVTILKGGLDYFTLINSEPKEQFWPTFKTYLGLNVFRSLYYLILSTVVWSAFNLGRFRRNANEALFKNAITEKANAELKFEYAEAQNAFLKQQINPHLLFNTLNAIYSSVYINSPQDSKVILLLSDIMRFSYKKADPKGRVPLKDELLQLRNLIKLNSYRFQKTFELEFNIVGHPAEFSIIPLVLITLTENMFKHGDLRVPPHSLEITINPDGHLRYITQNVPKARGNDNENTHVGLNNTRLRLDYAYPNNYELQITEAGDLFSLELNINLTYERNNN
ncbi:histidine kinase [Mucilaginibacter sabulilitoris]|uniref:Histidine kinase n=1 Tax=Mucilaginibacter sabulilitoris TaxID=1173583 RepID=A0ABZ0TS66_9SPHI|nr:histidine kinase [Mucilaginibacter sabulilitoris]WPU95754.1 histidine kinase [Mucilaginibacter sabulilitoris]